MVCRGWLRTADSSGRPALPQAFLKSLEKPIISADISPRSAVDSGMSLEQDLARIAQQEQTLRFDKFDELTAWDIGCRLKAAAEKRGASLAIDITLGGRTVFGYAQPGTTPNSANWLRRKRNTVLHFHRSSYGFGLQLERDKADLAGKFGVAPADYAVHGGSFPVWVNSAGVIGAITVSGLPQREDHKLVVSVLLEFLGKSAVELQLE